MNLLTLETRVASAIGLDLTNASEKSLIDGWINEAVEQFLVKTGVHRSEATMALTTNIGDYELPSAVVELNHVIVTDSGGNQIPLDPMQEHEILERRRYVSAGDTPYFYALAGANLLMLYPTPSSALTMMFYYVARPPSQLAAAGDDPSNVSFGGVPSQWHTVLEAYGKWKAADFDDDATSQEGLAYQQEWEKGLAQARATMNRMKGWAPARIGRRKRFPIRPGVDLGY